MGKVKNAQLVLTRRVCRTYVHIGKWPRRLPAQLPPNVPCSRIQDIRSVNYQYLYTAYSTVMYNYYATRMAKRALPPPVADT